MPPFTAFVEFTKAFDTISRSSLYKESECPPLLLKMTAYFQEEDDQCNLMEVHMIVLRSTGIKQGCVLASTLFGIYRALTKLVCTSPLSIPLS